ncbi:hypothetical protein [Sphingopyxis sp. 550A]
MKAYAGKHMDVSLELASLERRGKVLRGQFRAGQNADVFVEFSPDWEDYLLSKNVGDTIRFRVKILGDEALGYGLGEASPLYTSSAFDLGFDGARLWGCCLNRSHRDRTPNIAIGSSRRYETS